MPPSGGFSGEVPYKRHLPARGPPGWVWLSGFAATIISGFYLHSRGLRIRKYPGKAMIARIFYLFSELKREKRQARLALMPLLLAEQDRVELFRRTRMLDLEARAMKDVPGWVPGESPYKSDSEAARSAKPAVSI